MKKILLVVIVFLVSFYSQAATVDTVAIYSNAMKKTFNCVVIVPDNEAKAALPVVYLLHGYSGDFSNWIKKAPDLKKYADEYQLFIVCPDGGYSSWYFDSPVDSVMRYETYIAKEVPAFIDKRYKTIRNRSGRAITGLSMGGHGGLFLGFRHASDFVACGSMSGGVELNNFRKSFDIRTRLGDTIVNADNWKKYTVMNVIEKYPRDSISIIFDCGVDDFFYNDNRHLHEKMLQLKIPHDYIERPGKHDWPYWGNAVKYQLVFFKNAFDKARKKV